MKIKTIARKQINRIIMEFKSVICDEGYTTEGQINRIIMEFKSRI